MFLNHSFCFRAEKDAKKKGTILIKEFEKSKREIEKEKKKMERELLKEKLQSVCDRCFPLFLLYIFLSKTPLSNVNIFRLKVVLSILMSHK